jgi:hypothetical protein
LEPLVPAQSLNPLQVPRQRQSTLAPTVARSPAQVQLDAARLKSGAPRQRQSTLAPTGSASTSKASSAPLIARPFSATELLRLAFGLSPTFSKSELIAALDRHKIEDFAAGCYRKHRTATFPAKPVPLAELIAWSKTPLRKPLLQSVPTSLKKTAALVFEFVLEYTEVRPCPNRVNCARKILHYVREHPESLADELYFQLVKQTIACKDPRVCLRAWELFLIASTIFPASEERYLWILSHIARNTMDPDERVSLAATFIYMRFQSRYFLATPLDYETYVSQLEKIPMQVIKGKTCFGCIIYEAMYCQREEFPKLPIPYVVHLIVTTLKERNALRTPDIFTLSGNEGITASILADVNENVKAVTKGDVHILASLLKIWLKQLANPLVPFELTAQFMDAGAEGHFLGFFENLPQVYRLTSLYIIGFLKEVAANSEYNGLERGDLAMMFGPLFVDPLRASKGDTEIVQKLNELGIGYVGKLIDVADPAIIYPMNPVYLPLQALMKSEKVSIDAEKSLGASIASLSLADLDLDDH